MTDIRNTGTVAAARFDDAQQKKRWFVKVVFPGAPGTLRYTSLHGGFVGDIDGSSQTWTHFPFKVGPLQQGADTAMDVSWIEFGASDPAHIWVGYLKTPGVREVPCTVYRAHFNVSTGAIYGAYAMYPGEMDEGRDGGTAVRIVLVPTSERAQVPGRSYLPHMPEFLLMPRPNETITLGTTTVELPTAPTTSPWGYTPPMITVPYFG